LLCRRAGELGVEGVRLCRRAGELGVEGVRLCRRAGEMGMGGMQGVCCAGELVSWVWRVCAVQEVCQAGCGGC
jgi:hypothetical protein